MPYVNRYFHKRDVIVPYRFSYKVGSPPMGKKYINGQNQRHVTTYEYPFHDSVVSNTPIKENGIEKHNSVYISNSPVKYDYQKRYYTKKKGINEKEIKLVSEGSNSKNNLRAKIKCPSGNIQFCDIIHCDDNNFDIRFTPTEIGEHNILVKQEKVHVPGSPFKIVVGDLELSRAQNVQIVGLELSDGVVNKTNSFSVLIKDLGSGILTISIDGPSKAVIDMTENEPGFYNVKYNMSVSGEYVWSIKFNGEHVPGSPFKINIQNINQKDSICEESIHKNTFASIKNHGIVVGRSTSITLNQSGLNNKEIKAYMETPSNRVAEIKVSQTANDHFNIRLTPEEKGRHKIYVLLDETPIPGCPFEVIADEIVAIGKGLGEAMTGEVCTFKLNTINADPGPINISIEGPSKVELKCLELDDGFEFSFCPFIPGDYLVTIKYKNNDIQGSPFKVLVHDNGYNQINSSIISHKVIPTNHAPTNFQSYPENVKCEGSGILKAEIGRNNQFIVDASLGGYGVLLVGINGPSRPCEEIHIKHIGEKRFHVNYFIQDFGKYFITIKWNDVEIPDSPFQIYVQ